MKRLRVRLLQLGVLLIPVALSACGSRPSDPTRALLTEIGGSGPATRADPAEILAADIEGDTLRVQVSYGGGCREHTFSLQLSGVFRESYPVQTDLRLLHDSRRDPCRALLQRTLRFDLTPLKESYRRSYPSPDGAIAIFLFPPHDSPPFHGDLIYAF